MAKAGLAWINRVDAAVLTASSEVSSLPVADLQSEHLSDIWRTSAAPPAWLGADFGAAVEIGVVGIFGTNLTPTATWRIRLSNVALGNGEVLDTGTIGAGVKAGYRQALHVPAAPLTARYARLDLDDAGLAGLYVQAGRLWAGPLWRPARNFRYGAAPGRTDPSARTPSKGGQIWTDVRAQARAQEFELAALSEAELLDGPLEADRLAGIVKAVLFVPDPAAAEIGRRAVLGLIEDLTPAPLFAHDLYRKAYRIVERL